MGKGYPQNYNILNKFYNEIISNEYFPNYSIQILLLIPILL